MLSALARPNGVWRFCGATAGSEVKCGMCGGAMSTSGVERKGFMVYKESEWIFNVSVLSFCSVHSIDPVCLLMHKLAGQGTFGCVYKPPIVCHGEPDRGPATYENAVSKILASETAAEKELESTKLIDIIDPTFDFHLQTPVHCKADISDPNAGEWDQCNWIKKAPDAKTIVDQLLIPDGGIDINSYKLSRKTQFHVVNLLKEFDRLFHAVITLKDNKYAHGDIHRGNILYNESDNRINLIDFGAMAAFDKI